jgi:outer membrane protein assembly factor BamD (BamD/ComL family)
MEPRGLERGGSGGMISDEEHMRAVEVLQDRAGALEMDLDKANEALEKAEGRIEELVEERDEALAAAEEGREFLELFRQAADRHTVDAYWRARVAEAYSRLALLAERL